jgi:superfamily II RNA helicase
MVVICNSIYPNDSIYNAHFDLFPYQLSDFQKYSIHAVIEGNHSLVTAHTGTGKSVPAEFAIQYFTQKGKKVIYTSPIKALSNQKYHDFTQKYPTVSFGIMTGDIKVNPDADVLIMTTEILMNYLFTLNKDENQKTNLDFQIDIENELACVVFDEIHYINDADRGHVWEQTILMLPSHIQMIMLSATIDKPEKFAGWCENIHKNKQVYLSYTNTRIVPLTHYGYLITNESIFKKIKDKETQQKIRDKTNKLIPLKDANGVFQENGYLELKKMKQLFDNNEVMVKRQHVLNNLSLYLRERDMLPAIAFVFSRKNVELYAKEITTPLLEDDSKVSYTIRRECEQIIRKLPNYQEYLDLPQYNELIILLERGIGIHHSGMIPILREIVELMIDKKYIKLLFATESFAIGLNCPIRTAIFTSLTKYDGNGRRFLMAHEYNQAASRCGRRGIDTIGHVVHCNNLFEYPVTNEYKELLCGKPQILVSKFHVSFSVILNLIRNGKTHKSDFYDFVKKSMVQSEIQNSILTQKEQINKIHQEYEKKKESIKYLRTPLDICEKYIHNELLLPTSVNKKRKEIQRTMEEIVIDYKNCPNDSKEVIKLQQLKVEYDREVKYMESIETYIEDNINNICNILEDNDFIISVSENTYQFTTKGKISSCISEIHPLIVGNIIHTLEKYTSVELVGLLSCFTDIKVDFDIKSSVPTTQNETLKQTINEITTQFTLYENLEIENNLNTGFNYEDCLMFDIIDEIQEWCNCLDEIECKKFIQTRLADKQISVGDFTKSILKISNISKELMNACNDNEMMDLYNKLYRIDSLILKYIATSQSLYV